MPQFDLLQTYLIVANAAAFIVGALDGRMRSRRDGSGISPFVSIIFSLMGGPIGVIVSSIIFDSHLRKDNVAQRFFAIWSLAAWALALANIYGWSRFDQGRLMESLGRNHTPLWIYLVAVNILTFTLFCVDKSRARKGAWRIPEGILLGCVLAGGSVGGMLGMAVAHHKVRKAYFRVGLPLAFVLQVAILAYLLQAVG